MIMEGIGGIIRPACIAFSMFSNIPVPQFEWKEKDMKYMMLYFPFVGIIIGLISFLWWMFCQKFSVERICFALIGAAIPLFISGGIHADGYMDTMDAFHSFQGKEEKLRILKDPHIGAFSVIKLLLYYLIYVGAYSEIQGMRVILLVSLGFFLSRTLSAVSTVCFQGAKTDGLAHLFSSQSDKRTGKFVFFIQFLVCSVSVIYISPLIGSCILSASLFLLFYYRRRCMKEFGGITGDTAGYFLLLCEEAVAVIAALGCISGFL